MRTAAVLLLATVLAAADAPAGAAPSPDDALRAELKPLLERATRAFSAQDPAAMLEVLAPRFVVVMADQQLASDRAGLEAGVQRWIRGADAPFASVAFVPTVDVHATAVGADAALAAGTSHDTYTFKDGRSATVDSRWSATLVRTADGWRIAQLHLGIDPLDNPMMAAARAAVVRWSAIAGGAALAAGLLLGWLLGRRRAA